MILAQIHDGYSTGPIHWAGHAGAFLVEGNRAAGVRMTDGREVRVPIIISDAGAANTFIRLLPKETAGRTGLGEPPPLGGSHVPVRGAEAHGGRHPVETSGGEYEHFKARFADRLLEQLYIHVPQVRGKVDYSEQSTPLSTRHFSGHPRGEMYGLSGTS